MARWFTIALGFTGWLALALPSLLGLDRAHASAAWTALFFAVILASRALVERVQNCVVLSDIGTSDYAPVIMSIA